MRLETQRDSTDPALSAFLSTTALGMVTRMPPRLSFILSFRKPTFPETYHLMSKKDFEAAEAWSDKESFCFGNDANQVYDFPNAEDSEFNIVEDLQIWNRRLNRSEMSALTFSSQSVDNPTMVERILN